MPKVRRWQAKSKNIKNRCGDGAHQRTAFHFLMNGCQSLQPCLALANVTLCKAICSERQRPPPPPRQPHHSHCHFQIFFIICCQKPGRGCQEWQVRVWQAEHGLTRAIFKQLGSEIFLFLEIPACYDGADPLRVINSAQQVGPLLHRLSFLILYLSYPIWFFFTLW